MKPPVHDKIAAPDFVTKQLDEQTFFALKSQWQELLSRSDADALFLSWQWLSAWWTNWGRDKDELCIIAVFKGDSLKALAPLYLSHCKLKATIPITRLAFMGTRYLEESGILTEHLQFILDREYEEPCLNAILDYVEHKVRWDDWIIEGATKSSSTCKKLLCDQRDWYTRLIAETSSYQIDCSNSFDSYLKSLGKHTRLKLFNRRKLFESSPLKPSTYADQRFPESTFQALNTFHSKRFNTIVFEDRNIAFLEDYMSQITPQDTYSSVLYDGDTIISAIFNIRVGGTLYNFQLGYQEQFDKRISLGLLHLGYSIENSMHDSSINQIDLLSGGGKNTDYKKKIATSETKEASFQIVRSKRLKALYQLYDRLIRKR